MPDEQGNPTQEELDQQQKEIEQSVQTEQEQPVQDPNESDAERVAKLDNRSDRARQEQQLQEQKKAKMEELRTQGVEEGSPEWDEQMNNWVRDHQADLHPARQARGDLDRPSVTPFVGSNRPRQAHQSLIERAKNLDLKSGLHKKATEEDHDYAERITAIIAANADVIDEQRLANIVTFVEGNKGNEKLVQTVDLLLRRTS